MTELDLSFSSSTALASNVYNSSVMLRCFPIESPVPPGGGGWRGWEAREILFPAFLEYHTQLLLLLKGADVFDSFAEHVLYVAIFFGLYILWVQWWLVIEDTGLASKRLWVQIQPKAAALVIWISTGGTSS